VAKRQADYGQHEEIVMRAVYKDKQGRTYSCPVEVHGSKWQMQTSDGFQDITFHFQDDVGGLLTFDCYRDEPQSADSRLHVQAGSTWTDHKQAFAEQELAEQRKQRQAGRTEIQNVPPDPAKVAAARELNVQILRERRPRGRGVGILIE
jgi:hypothetical protein